MDNEEAEYDNDDDDDDNKEEDGDQSMGSWPKVDSSDAVPHAMDPAPTIPTRNESGGRDDDDDDCASSTSPSTTATARAAWVQLRWNFHAAVAAAATARS